MSTGGSQQNQPPEVLLERARLVQVTIRLAIICVCSTVSIGLICWAIVNVLAQPPWLVLCLAIFGPSGTVAVFWLAYLGYLGRKLKQATKKLETQQRQLFK